MISILIATISIVIISAIVSLIAYILKKTKHKLPLCPICLGVGFTWLWLWIAGLLGQDVDETTLALLMGGIVVGLAYQLTKLLPSKVSPKLWKALFVPIGFLVFYGLVFKIWILFGVSLIASALLIAGVFWLPFLSKNKRRSSHDDSDGSSDKSLADLEKDLEDCCD